MSKDSQDWLLLKSISVPSLIVTLILNYTFTSGIGDNSDMYLTKFTPANWAFSIWGLIYAALAFVILTSRSFHRVDTNLWFLASCALNVGWVVLWSYIDQDRRHIVSANVLLLFLPVTIYICLLYTSPSPRDVEESRMPSSA